MQKEVVIITDSSCDMPKEYLERNDIHVIPFAINIHGESYFDTISIDTKEMFVKIDKYNEITKTAAISAAVFQEAFSRHQNADIIYIGIGTGFSSSTSVAETVAKEFTNVWVVDSENLSAGVGLLLNKAILLRKKGLSASLIAEELRDIVPRVRVQFAINTLKYLHMGGRCSGVSRFLGTALNLKPVIKVQNNKMIVAKKPVGYKHALKTLLKYLEKDKDNLDPDLITITHCFADEDALFLRKKIEEMAVCSNLLETYAGCTISTHCGKRCIGILYILKTLQDEEED